MWVVLVLGFFAVLLTKSPGMAQQPSLPLFAPVRSQPIPGGVLKWADTAGATTEDSSLTVAHHTVRSYSFSPLGYQKTAPPPPTVYVDGKPVITEQSSLPRPEAVLTGGGRTYVRIFNGVDEDHPPDLWIMDVSGPTVTITRKIKGCNPKKQAVVDGAYVLVCDVNGEKRTVTHSYKDGVLK